MTTPPVLSTAFVDANVLYASTPRAILIELAMVDVIAVRWSQTVLDELVRALLRRQKDYTQAKAHRLIAAMTGALPEAMIVPPVPTLPLPVLPDPDDVHVLLAAAHGRCDSIVTFNLSDFPAGALSAHAPGLVAIHPDEFLVGLIASAAPRVLPIIEKSRQALKAPPMSVATFADSLATSKLVKTAELLRHLLQ